MISDRATSGVTTMLGIFKSIHKAWFSMVSSFRVDHKILLQAECFRNVNHMYDGIDQMVEIQKYYICDRIHCKEKMLIPYTKMRQIKLCKLISIVEISPECLYLDKYVQDISWWHTSNIINKINSMIYIWLIIAIFMAYSTCIHHPSNSNVKSTLQSGTFMIELLFLSITISHKMAWKTNSKVQTNRNSMHTSNES